MVVDAVSKVVLAGYSLLVVSGVALIASGTHPESPRFWAKMVVVAVIGLNGLAAHHITFPRLADKMNTSTADIAVGFLHQLSVTTAISTTSWYVALVIGAWKISTIPFALWMGGYAFVLMGAVATSLLLTPWVLRVDDPEFETVFPVLASAALQAASIMPEHDHYLEAAEWTS
jgi:hypothetical protein